MSVYYSENDPFAAAWLRNLIAAGHIASGEVDERSIVDVRPDDLRGYSQCHFFAGIGGWSLALRLAGWPDDEPVWTGSCPCQPFSAAGKQAGTADKRHLWPDFRRLIEECRPSTIFGEQVASAGVVGGTRSSIQQEISPPQSGEGLGAPCEATRFQERRGIRSRPAFAGPSETYRQRLVRDFWPTVQSGWWQDLGQPVIRQDQPGARIHTSECSGCPACGEFGDGRLGRCQNAGDCPRDHGQAHRRLEHAFRKARTELDEATGNLWLTGVRVDLEALGYNIGACDLPAASAGAPHIRQRLFWVADAGRGDDERRGRSDTAYGTAGGDQGNGHQRQWSGPDTGHRGATGGLADHDGEGRGERAQRDGWPVSEGEVQQRPDADRCGDAGRMGQPKQPGLEGHAGHGDRSHQPGRLAAQETGPVAAAGCDGFWSNYDIVHCSDGKARRFEPGSFPLAHGVSSRVGRLRAYGNAIVPQVAATFIEAFLDSTGS